MASSEGMHKRKERSRSFISRWRRELLTLAAAGALGVGSAEYSQTVEENHSPRYSTDWEHVRTQTSFDLSPLEKIAHAKVEVVGTKYIFHVAQIHGADSLTFTKRYYQEHNIPFERLIECQKQVEEALAYLHTKYGIEKVFVENLIPEDAASYEHTLKKLKEEPLQTGMELMYQGASDSKGNPPPEFFDHYRAIDLLFAAEALKGTDAGESVQHDPLINNDTRYVWGAPYLMAARGDIKLAAAETATANATAIAKGFGSDAGFKVRQDAAIEQIRVNTKEDPNSVALVYGASHDFTNTITESNAQQKLQLGLIRIDPYACK